MTKKWNIVAVVMLLGSFVQATPGSQIATQAANQMAEAAGREIVAGAGRRATNALSGAFHKTRTNLESKKTPKVELSQTEGVVNVSATAEKQVSSSVASEAVAAESNSAVVSGDKQSWKDKGAVQDVKAEAAEKVAPKAEATEAKPATEKVAPKAEATEAKPATEEAAPKAEATEAKPATEEAAPKAEATEEVAPKASLLQTVKGYAVAPFHSVAKGTRYTADSVRNLFKAKEVSASEASKVKAATEEVPKVTVDSEVAPESSKTVLERMKAKLPNNPFVKSEGASYTQRVKDYVGKHKFALGAASTATIAATGAALYNWFDNVAEDNGNDNNTDVITSSSSSLLTKKNAIIATAAVAAAAAGYYMFSMFTKPTFEELVTKYVEETVETNPQVIVEQFCAMLKQYGYTSEVDQQKAIEVLQAKGYVEA